MLNEYDYLPLEMLHFILRKLKLIRHYKATCRITKTGAELADKPGAVFNLIAPFYLFQIDHAALSRLREPAIGNWDVFLGVLNVEAKHGVSCTELRRIFYGSPDPSDQFDRMPSMIHDQIIKPLCWMGLLVGLNTDNKTGFDERYYAQTSLWEVTFSFPFDPVVEAPIRH